MPSTLFALQGIRALAATLVAAAHLIMRLVKYEILSPDWQRYEIAGWVGVVTFFVISGLIMIKTSWSHFGCDNAPANFMLRRLIRILPLYYIFTTLMVVKMTVVNEPWGVNELVMSALFFPYINKLGLMQPIYSLGWTLNYELYFYTILAICLFFKRRIGVVLIFVTIILVVLLGRVFGSRTSNGDPQDVIAFFGNSVVLFFLAGIFIGIIPSLTRFRAQSTACLFTASGLMLAAVVMSNLALVVALCILAVWVTTLERSSASDIGPVESAMAVAGDASYSIYLTHSFILGPAVAAGLKIGILSSSLNVVLFSVVCLVTCVAVGILAFHWIERPLLRYLRDRLLRTAPRRSLT